jgi:hypothetical protein
MKKIIVLFLLILPNLAFAIDYSCFENLWNIKNPESKTIKIVSDSQSLYFYQDDKLLNSRLFKDYQRKSINYDIVNKKDLEINWNTISFDQYNINKEIIVKFPQTLEKNTFNYEINSNSYDYKFEISKDWKTYFKINDNLKNYDLDYLKISFQNWWKIKNVSVFSLDFFNFWNYEFLVNSKSNSEIKAYSNYICNDNKLYTELEELTYTPYFPTDIDTKTYNLEILQNLLFDQNHLIEYKTQDSDNDWIADIKDNCPKDYNPKQLDSSSNWIWDICDDKDNDNIKWKVDNCPTIYNPDQKDTNKDWIWDACEIDSDNDSIFDSLDNCKLKANKDQKDIDKDWIWDVCDNCEKKYNPDQKDVDKDWIWDICDKKDDRFIESNKYFFIWFVIFIVIIFMWAIFSMIRKISKLNK